MGTEAWTCPRCQSKLEVAWAQRILKDDPPRLIDCFDCGQVAGKCSNCGYVGCSACGWTNDRRPSPKGVFEWGSTVVGFALMALAVPAFFYDPVVGLSLGVIGAIVAGWWKGGFP